LLGRLPVKASAEGAYTFSALPGARRAPARRGRSPSFELTQHFLAQMLAVRRTSVSDVAQSLAEDGCLTYTRGLITITDRPRLQANACDCYAVIRRATDAAFAVR
jgi:hypothetical protein